jgi:hypothetical protein
LYKINSFHACVQNILFPRAFSFADSAAQRMSQRTNMTRERPAESKLLLYRSFLPFPAHRQCIFQATLPVTEKLLQMLSLLFISSVKQNSFDSCSLPFIPGACDVARCLSCRLIAERPLLSARSVAVSSSHVTRRCLITRDTPLLDHT